MAAQSKFGLDCPDPIHDRADAVDEMEAENKRLQTDLEEWPDRVAEALDRSVNGEDVLDACRWMRSRRDVLATERDALQAALRPLPEALLRVTAERDAIIRDSQAAGAAHVLARAETVRERDALKAEVKALRVWERHYKVIKRTVAERDALREALEGLLLSADASWEGDRQGHDWHEACVRARAALPTKPYTIADSNQSQSGRYYWMNKCEDAGRSIGDWRQMRDEAPQ